jgi:hypothetical protein
MQVYGENEEKKDSSFLLIGLAVAGLIALIVILLVLASFFVLGLFEEKNYIKLSAGLDSSKAGEWAESQPEEKRDCPFECCSAKIYKEKQCTAPLICSNNSCKLPVCTKECCIEGEGFQEKDCSEGLECIDNECLKPECPFICCMKSDKEFREKKCVGGLRCVGRVCSLK